MDNCWKLPGGECCFEPPEGYYGFIYLIIDDKGMNYWGKKSFFHSQKKKISKKARKESGTKKRVEKVKKDSLWLDYWGSCKPLLEYIENRGGTHGFERHIVKLCKDKSSLSYWEVAIQILNNVLFIDGWNNNVGGRYFKGKIHK